MMPPRVLASGRGQLESINYLTFTVTAFTKTTIDLGAKRPTFLYPGGGLKSGIKKTFRNDPRQR